VLEPFRAYVERRLADDPHLDATVLLRELRPLGFERSYQTLTRELRRLELRPACPVCKRGGQRLTVELVHEPGEELQIDWLELTETPWGEPCYVLVGALSHSGRIRAVVSDRTDFAHLVSALDRVLRGLGGTARSWRTDRMATIVVPGTDRLRPEAAELAKHYGVTIAVCPRYRPQRKALVSHCTSWCWFDRFSVGEGPALLFDEARVSWRGRLVEALVLVVGLGGCE
jgi:transposase